MRGNDLSAVLSIEQDSFESPCSRDVLINMLKQRTCIGLVALQNELVVGYVVYEMIQDRLHILKLAVDPYHRRNFVGHQIIKEVFRKREVQRRTHIVAEVPESNLPAQLFFRAMGFRCVQIIPKHCHQNDEDEYLFRFDPNI